MCTGVAYASSADSARVTQFTVVESLDIAEVPAGFPVQFCLLTEGQRQYVGYFDSHRRLTVASRWLDSSQWQYQVLPSSVGWDSHNYITMAVDREGHLHVSGNMHCVPLIYFRTQIPGNIQTLQRLDMTGQQEQRTTYPRFLTDADGELIFHYRSGSSGNGMRLFNRYHRPSQTWSRLLEKPLLDGQGQRNAYPSGPGRGPDGWFHMDWVWRDTSDCATNHHLSYARSRDLVHWESASGKQVTLPILLDDQSLWVDPIPSGGGIINGCQKLFVDADNRPILAYHKADTDGNMQIYATRFQRGEWKQHRLTNWDKSVPFGGGGSMGFIGISISGLSRQAPGVLSMTCRHRDYGSRRLVIDEETLTLINRTVSVLPKYPWTLNHMRSDFEGMRIRRATDSGQPNANVHYILQWETLGRNFDRPRKPPLPAPAMLRLHKLSATQAVAAREKQRE
jgi:hypothetical protein